MYPDGAVHIRGMLWSVKMIAKYYGTTPQYIASVMKIQNVTLEDVLINPAILRRKRKWVDVSVEIIPDWTLAMIYYVISINHPSVRELGYKTFANRLQNELRQLRGLMVSIDHRTALGSMLDKMGVNGWRDELSRVDIHNVRKRYEEYIGSLREYDNDQADLPSLESRYYDCVMADRSARAYHYKAIYDKSKEHDKIVAELQNRVDTLTINLQTERERCLNLEAELVRATRGSD